jgi:hypothetical protein
MFDIDFWLTRLVSLTWWQMILWIVYAIYFLLRAYDVWDEVTEYGFKKGYKHILIGQYKKDLRLYHVIRMIFDIPPMIIGITFPTFKKLFSLKLYTFKDEKKKTGEPTK